MRKLFLLLFSIPSLLFCQPNFWSHYSLDFEITNLFQTRPDVIYANNYDILMNSSDYGITWDTLYTATASIYNLYHNKNILQEDKLIIRENSSSVPIKLSFNSGQDWEILNLPPGISIPNTEFAIDATGNIYALDDTLYKSSDNGVTWEEVNAPPKDPRPDVSSSYSAMSIDPAGTIYMSVSSSEFIPPAEYHWWENYYSSEDEGASWLHIIWGGLYSELGYMFTVREQDLFVNVSVSPYTFHYNKDFIPVIRNYPFYGIYSAVINKFGLIYLTAWTAIGSSSDVYYSNNDGDSWSEESSGLNSSSASSMLIDSLGYLYVSTNEGIFKSNFTSFNFITDSAVVFEDTKIADTTFKSVTIVNPYPFTLEIDSLVTYPNNFFITEIGNGSIDPLDSIDITFAYSPTEFGELSGNTFLYFNDISGNVKLFGKSPHPVLIYEPIHSFGVIDVGQSKTDTIWVANNSLNDIIVDSMNLVNDMDFSVGELIFPQLLEQNDSLMITATFNPTSVGIKRDTLTIFSNAENSVAKISLYGIATNPVGVEGNEEIIIDFALYQNFPNPFNPTTTIKYSVPKQSHVKLVIYNSLGEVIITLVDQTREMGNYVVNFNGENLSSGIYFYRMQAGNYIAARKLILLK